MLTMPILSVFWFLATMSLCLMVWSIIKRRWGLASAFYLFTGFIGIAVPFKIALHATSIFAMFFLSVIWPLWMLQTPLNFDILSHCPLWFQQLMFTFS